MRGEADREAEAARGLDGEVVLSDVHPIGLGEDGEVGAVVDDQGDAELARDRAGLDERFEQGPVGEALVAELDEVDASADGAREEVGEVRPRRRDEVEPAARGLLRNSAGPDDAPTRRRISTFARVA